MKTNALSRLVRLLAWTALAATASLSAHAGPMIYTSASAFNAATSQPGLDTFDNFSNTMGTNSPIFRTTTGAAYGYGAAVSTTDFLGAGTGADHWLSTDTATDTITFNTFTGGVIAGIGGFFFGSDISGLFKAVSSITVVATDASGSTSSMLINPGTTTFLGFVSSSVITSLTVTSNQPTSGQTWPTVNNLVLAQAGTSAPGPVSVPEPDAAALVGLGLIAVWLGRQRRRPRA